MEKRVIRNTRLARITAFIVFLRILFTRSVMQGIEFVLLQKFRFYNFKNTIFHNKSNIKNWFYLLTIKQKFTKSQKAFTLVELAIVIVVISFLIAGVLQGKELVNQAQIRSQIKQLEGWNAATVIFRDKYRFLPGDIPLTYAATFGLTQQGCGGCASGWEPNGNGLINDLNNNMPPTALWTEPRIFFIHLQDAKLIITDNLSLANVNNAWGVGEVFPEAKIGVGGVAALNLNDGLYYFFGPTRKNDATNNSAVIYQSHIPSLTTVLSSGLDQKLDDGIPSSGGVRAVTSSLVNDSTLNNCLGVSNQVYNLASDGINCRLVVKSIVN